MFRVVGLGLQLGMLGLIIGSRADTKWPQLLAGGYACARICIATSHIIIAWCIPRARKLSSMTAAAGLLLAAAPTWLALHKDAAYTTHWVVMAIVAAGESCGCRSFSRQAVKQAGACSVFIILCTQCIVQGQLLLHAFNEEWVWSGRASLTSVPVHVHAHVLPVRPLCSALLCSAVL
jgi:hypothetical protein